MKNSKPGFTLIELMITVMIFSILVIIAYPSYMKYLQKSRRSDAFSALARDQMSLERCYAQNFSYVAACTNLTDFPHNSEQNYYNIAISNLGVSTYTLTATAIGIQAQDKDCAMLRIDQTNTKTATNSEGTAQTTCWN